MRAHCRQEQIFADIGRSLRFSFAAFGSANFHNRLQ